MPEYLRDYLAIGIPAAFALVAFLPLAWRNLGRTTVWVCLAAGAGVGYLAREGTQLVLEWLSPVTGPSAGPLATVMALLVAAGIGELLKATPTMVAIAVTRADESAGLAYGAAAGAGFAFVVTQPVLAMALALYQSPLTTPLSAGLAIAGWFFRILAHVVTTAFVGRAGVRGGLGTALLLVWLVQFLLGLADRLPFVGGFPTGLAVTIVVSQAFFWYLWRLRAGAPSERDQGLDVMTP